MPSQSAGVGDDGGVEGMGVADFQERRRDVARAASTSRPLSPLPSTAQPLPHLGSPTSHGQDFSRWPQGEPGEVM